jgi:hypothetical protein
VAAIRHRDHDTGRASGAGTSAGRQTGCARTEKTVTFASKGFPVLARRRMPHVSFGPFADSCAAQRTPVWPLPGAGLTPVPQFTEPLVLSWAGAPGLQRRSSHPARLADQPCKPLVSSEPTADSRFTPTRGARIEAAFWRADPTEPLGYCDPTRAARSAGVSSAFTNRVAGRLSLDWSYRAWSCSLM